MNEPNTYKLGEKFFHQEKLAWRQIRALLSQLEGLSFSSVDPVGLVSALGAKLGTVVAVVLIPGIESRQEHMDRLKNTEKFQAHIDEIEDLLELDTAAEVVRDFLSLNQISYVSEVVEEIKKKLGMEDEKADSATTLKEFAPLSQEAPRHTATVS